jgi:hypothetical protein
MISSINIEPSDILVLGHGGVPEIRACQGVSWRCPYFRNTLLLDTRVMPSTFIFFLHQWYPTYVQESF